MDEATKTWYSLINSQQQQNNAWSASQAQKAMDYQTQMSNTAHQREVADLKAAGLNPVLSAGGSGATTGSGVAATAGNENVTALYGLAKQAIDANIQQAKAMENSAKYITGAFGSGDPKDSSDLINHFEGLFKNSKGDLFDSDGNLKLEAFPKFLQGFASFFKDLQDKGFGVDSVARVLNKASGGLISFSDAKKFIETAKENYNHGMTDKDYYDLVQKQVPMLKAFYESIGRTISENAKRMTGYYGSHATTSHFGESNSDSKVRHNKSRYSEQTQHYN